MTTFLLGSAIIASLSGCFLLGDGGASDANSAAEAKLIAGDLPGADNEFGAAVADHSDHVDLATGAAFLALEKGNYDAADQFLVTALDGAEDRAPELLMRRALVALRAGDLDAVASHGVASGLPAGKLLAAEVALADGEREDARGLLTEASAAGGKIGTLAQDYLTLLDDEDPMVAGLSEAQALWALGTRKVAVRSIEDVVLNLPDSFEARDEQILLWAGRAASVGEAEVARSMLDGLIFAPEGQQWRKVATIGLIACASGDGTTCVRTMKGLEGTAPEDGLADARATAAVLIASADPEAATRLAGPYISNAAARALLETGDVAAAKESSPGGALGQFIEAGG